MVEIPRCFDIEIDGASTVVSFLPQVDTDLFTPAGADLQYSDSDNTGAVSFSPQVDTDSSTPAGADLQYSDSDSAVPCISQVDISLEQQAEDAGLCFVRASGH